MPKTPLHETAEGRLLALAIVYSEVAPLVAELPQEAYMTIPGRAIARAVRALLEAGSDVSIVAVQAWLVESGTIGEAGGLTGLTGLVTEAQAYKGEAAQLAEQVRRNFAIAKIRMAGSRMLQLSEEKPLESVLEAIDRDIDDARSAVSSELPHKVIDLMNQRTQDTWGLGDGPTPPIRLGIDELDAIFRGFRPGEMTVLGARTSMGKSHFTIHAVKRAAVSYHRPAILFTLEMDEGSVVDRLLASVTYVPSASLRYPEVWGAPDTMDRLSKGISLLAKSQVYVSSRHRTPMQIRAAASRIKAREKDLGLIAIDYLELLTDDSKEDSEVERLGKLARSIRAMAIDLEVPVLLVHQVNRTPDRRGEGYRRPTLTDLRGSGHIEDAADAVLFLYRPYYYGEENAGEGLTEVIVAKQRNGRTGTVEVFMDLATGYVGEIERRWS